MAAISSRRCDIVAVLFLAVITLFRFWYAGHHELVQDEAYYWQWSRHLALGYYDNTPLMAFVIRLFTLIFGTNEIGVRAGAIVSALVASIFIYLLARRTLGASIALIAVVVANIIPLFAAGALLMTQDPVQLAFWSATLYVAWLAVEPEEPSPIIGGQGARKEGGRGVRWLLAGVLAGLTAMSKLNGLLILPSIFLYLCLAPSARKWLKHPAPYIAAAIALALFAPFIWWNHTHENAFWIHIHAMGSRGQENGFTLRWLGEFLGAQAVLVSPFFFLTYLWQLVSAPNLRISSRGPRHEAGSATSPSPATAGEGWRSRGEGSIGEVSLFLWCASTVVFVATLVISLRSRVEGNWAAAAYISGMILVAGMVVRTWPKPLGKIWHVLSLLLALALTTLILFPNVGYTLGLQRWPALGLDAAHDRTNELYGWRAMAKRVDPVRNMLGGPEKCFVFGVNYRIPSELAFYLPDNPETYSLFLHDRANEYMFWENEKDLIGKNAVFVNVADTSEHLADCRAVFERVVPQSPLAIYRVPYKQPIRTVQIFACYGFKGYNPKLWQRGW
ncbi:MAG TPA: glycosyltransferase family 39 protein [Capsulimonadaceae bacterium]|nr:glycosyltransferase family 39 protein [Capsulimonadaceae bacterium]